MSTTKTTMKITVILKLEPSSLPGLALAEMLPLHKTQVQCIQRYEQVYWHTTDASTGYLLHQQFHN
jgi:hypothetical protein